MQSPSQRDPMFHHFVFDAGSVSVTGRALAVSTTCDGSIIQERQPPFQCEAAWGRNSNRSGLRSASGDLR